MKKILLLAIAVMLLGCQKEEMNTERLVKINYSMTDNNSMTKALDHDLVLTSLNSLLPESLNVKMTKDKEELNVTTGNAVMLGLGTWHLSGNWGGSYTIIQSGIKMSNEPFIVVNDDLEVTWDKTEYSIPAYYDCFAFVFVADEVAKVEIKSAGEWQVMPLTWKDGIGMTFMNKIDGDNQTIKITPKIGKYNEKTFVFYSETDKDYHVERGKYYILHPFEVNSVECGDLGYSIDDWVRGDEL